ncbi:flagellar biosynthesis anti-sigma factor FlgM [Immundisolibacter sp.]|uniref:flagellar biosynthesis anti-sigma factor FlgM n=1 Tax=Immundisolibacter sp. TaxID=1934948 RepID=UPI0026226F5E|nr:flagellar biosynthesis anti-sigma factor FlgM [Immundisolibacter sp.]MDD3650841.1 flagellar biosynthesis anti-sigma factor FlgM [Immundisolibacter sp.]
MDITALSGTPETPKINTAPARSRAADAQATPAVASPGTDSVDLTDGARQMQDLQATVAGTPVVDADRVAALREAIANGSYRIDPQRIADGLLAQDRVALG